jgi:hypothetical protein
MLRLIAAAALVAAMPAAAAEPVELPCERA